MNIFINNKQHTVVHNPSIASLLTDLNLFGSKGIAIAVNNNIIPKHEWEQYELSENDHITIIRATQGG